MHKIKKWIFDEICTSNEKNRYKSYLKKLTRILIPHLCGYLAEEYVDEELEKNRHYDYYIKKGEDLDNLIEFLKDYSKKESDRDNVINDKIKSSLFVIVLSITFLTGIFKFFGSINPISELLMIIGLIYLFFSGMTAIQAILPRRYHNSLIDDKIKTDQIFSRNTKTQPSKIKKSLEEKNKNFTELENYFEISTFKNRKIEASKLYRSIILNDLIILKKINYMDVTFHGILLGTLFITVSFIIMIL